jgi:type VI secretion system protein ImpH
LLVLHVLKKEFTLLNQNQNWMPGSFSELLQEFYSLAGDYRAEVFAAELIKTGYSAESIYFKTASAFKRPGGRDVESLHIDEGEGRSDQLVVEVNREGLYDMLPEGIFHFRKKRSSSHSKEAILDDVRQNKLEEDQARIFFGPLENEFFHRRLQLEQLERDLLGTHSFENKRKLFENLFGSSRLLNDAQVSCLLYLLPVIYKIRGDMVKSAYCISLLLGYPAEIIFKGDNKVVVVDEVSVLGSSQLGINAIVGNCFFSGEPYYEIFIHSIQEEDLISFFAGGDNHALLSFLMPFLLPCNSSYTYRLDLAGSAIKRQLSGPETEMFLGYSSYI